VRFYEFYQDEKNYYLVTEYCEGGDLLAKVQMLNKLPEGKAAKILGQILSAMDTCHRKNIVHRDLKPENILFEGSSVESTVKVIDFGRSKLLMPKQKIVEKAGSVKYNFHTGS
jgi:calcium-dependent protein kinase